MLAIIFFGLMFGAALTLIAAEKAKPMIVWLEALNEVVIQIIHFARMLAPYGVACLIFTVASRFGFDMMIAVAAFVITVLIALGAHVGITLFAILRFNVGISPMVFVSRVKAALVTAFSTSSSSATLPTGLEVSETQLGIPRQIAGFVLPISSTMCMNGTAIFEGITVIFLAEIFNVDLTLIPESSSRGKERARMNKGYLLKSAEGGLTGLRVLQFLQSAKRAYIRIRRP